MKHRSWQNAKIAGFTTVLAGWHLTGEAAKDAVCLTFPRLKR
jgi:hypothetical protein